MERPSLPGARGAEQVAGAAAAAAADPVWPGNGWDHPARGLPGGPGRPAHGGGVPGGA
ncbi:hypothetical protein ABH931_006747, partial [Streptacidiphilus sp. MAP12-33]